MKQSEEQREQEFQEWLVYIDIRNPDGSLNEEAVMNELRDYSFILDQVSKVYSYVTNGLASKPNIYAFEIQSLFDEYVDSIVNEAVEEAERKAKAGEELAEAVEAMAKNTLDEKNFEIPEGENIGEYRHCEELRRAGYNDALQKIASIYDTYNKTVNE